MKLKTLLLSSALCLGLSAFAQTTFDGLVGHWKFDEGSGTAVSDELGNTNGELVNAAAGIWVEGAVGTALDFTQVEGGDAAYARFDGSGAANIAESFTISLWVKIDIEKSVGNEQSIISKGVPFLTTNEIDGGWYHISIKDRAIRLMVWDEDALSSPAGELPVDFEWNANEWYHIVGVRDISDYTLYTYLNGEEISTVEDGLFGSMTNFEDLSFGSVVHGVQTTAGETNFWDSNFEGSLDEVQLYNTALSAEEVKTMYDSYMNPSAVNDKYVDNLEIAPNPVTNNLMLQNATNIAKVEIYNLTGALVKTINSQNAVLINANVEDLSTGMYVIKAFNNDNTVSAGKFAKR